MTNASPAIPHVARVELLAIGSERYCRQHGFRVLTVKFDWVVSCEARGRRIAAMYMAAPTVDSLALPAYRAFRDETIKQFEFLIGSTSRGGLGVNVHVRADDPYANAAEMIADLRDNRRLKVYGTGGPSNEHPFLTDEENDMFRAVHDAFGHAATGRGFDRHGEEAAWLKHSSMYSPVARRAMTTETRGQNSTLIYYYSGSRFPEQKVLLLPDEFGDPANVTLLPPVTENSG